jgi:hypothetical protein
VIGAALISGALVLAFLVGCWWGRTGAELDDALYHLAELQRHP